MRILLIVGNGFDLNLGLPTSYRHFYKYYLEHTESRNEHVNKLKTIIKDDIENWSDLELKLGEVTEQFTSPNHFIAAFRDLKKHLTAYLKTVNSVEIPNIDKISTQFADDIIGFKKNLDPKYKSTYNSFVQNITDKKITLDILTFNYTDTIENIADQLEAHPEYADKIVVENIYHIHQQLNELGIILGVNDENQIQNKSLSIHPDIKATMIKPYINSEYVSGTDKECKQAIDRANMVILFGVSLGATDRMWWNYLGEQVAAYPKRIIYCPYEEDISALDMSEVIIRNNGLITRCANNMYLANNAYSAVTPKIYPIRANRMFDFGLTHNVEANHSKVIDWLTTKINATARI